MKNTYHFHMAKHMIFGILLIFIFTSCDDDKTPTTNEEFNGEELFRGILLLEEGRVLDKLPELAAARVAFGLDEYTEFQLDAYSKVNNAIVEGIKESNEGFFIDFKSQITSGDIKVVQNSLAEAGAVIFDVIKDRSTLMSTIYSSDTLSSSFENELSKFEDLRELGIVQYEDLVEFMDEFENLDARISIDKVMDLSIGEARTIDLNLEAAESISADRNMSVEQFVDVQRYVDLEMDFNPAGDVVVDVETVVFAVVAVAVAAAAVVVVVVGDSAIFNDLGGLYQEQLGAQIAVAFAPNQQP